MPTGQLVVPVALAGIALFLGATDTKAAPPAEVPPGPPQLPPPKPGDTAPPQVQALTEIRQVNGQPVRYFKPQVSAALLGMLSDSYLEPADISAGDEGGIGILIDAQRLKQCVIYHVRPLPLDPAARAALAAKGVLPANHVAVEVTKIGFDVHGSLNLPAPQVPGRLLVVGNPAARHIIAHPLMPCAMMIDAYQLGKNPGPPIPGQPPGKQPMPDNQPPIPPGGKPVPLPPPIVDDGLDADMPAALRAEVLAMLVKPDASPEALEAFATDLEPKYPRAASKLRARAAELRAIARAKNEARGFTPFKIRLGDLPYLVSTHYTGEPSRWHEIKKKGVPFTTARLKTHWNGTVELPLDWNAESKTLPPVAHGQSASSADDAPKPKGNGGRRNAPKPKEARSTPDDPNRPGSYPHPDRDERGRQMPPEPPLVADNSPPGDRGYAPPPGHEGA